MTIEEFKGALVALRRYDRGVAQPVDATDDLGAVTRVTLHLASGAQVKITARPGTGAKPDGYLGGIYYGVDDHDMRDIHDGALSLDTWRGLLADIVGCEAIGVPAPAPK